MKDLQAPTITLMVYEPVNEQAHDEPTAVPYVCEVQFYWPDWYEEWEMPIHIPDDSGIDVLQIVEAVVARLKSLAFDEVVYPLEAIE